MPRVNDAVAELLIDVATSSVGMMNKRKLLWLMNRGQDRPSAWAELLAEWERIGMSPDDLFGVDIGGNIVLFRSQECPPIQSVQEWAEN